MSTSRLLLLAALALVGTNASAALITFDAVVVGETSFGFDGDGDSLDDVIFSTSDPLGFRTAGPGPNQSFINEPGLEGTSLLDPDLRVDFLVGAVNSIAFGFALNSTTEDDFASFSLYDSADNLIASTSLLGLYTLPDGVNRSSFPEGFLSLSFNGLASYGLFDFTSDAGRFIIDNFQGTFGTTEEISVPEPTTLSLLGAALLFASVARRRRRSGRG